MKPLAFMSVLLITLFTLSYSQTKNDSRPKVSNQAIRKIECNIFKDESFDSTFIMNGNIIRLRCTTECQGDYSVPDTINESVVDLYQNRLFRFKLKSSEIDTQFVVTKEIIKEIYKDRNVYIKSLLVYPRIESIDTLNKTILIHAAFMYPRGLGGTDFFDDVLFDVTSKGKLVFKEILEYQEPGWDF
jgi:hypothetical protein